MCHRSVVFLHEAVDPTNGMTYCRHAAKMIRVALIIRLMWKGITQDLQVTRFLSSQDSHTFLYKVFPLFLPKA